MTETVTFKGKKLNLQGSFVHKGQIAPDCELIGQNFQSIKLSSFKGKMIVLLTVPSLDTAVCSTETKRFNQELEKHSEVLTGLCVSMDLPFAQSRWCAAEGIKNVVTLSDYKNREFGKSYGVFLPELGLLARAVFLIDAHMTIQATYLVNEVTHEPNYKEILEKIQQMISQKTETLL